MIANSSNIAQNSCHPKIYVLFPLTGQHLEYVDFVGAFEWQSIMAQEAHQKISTKYANDVAFLKYLCCDINGERRRKNKTVDGSEQLQQCN